MYICKSVTENCVNPDSYGMICVGCGKCGRKDELKTYSRFICNIDLDPFKWHPMVQYGDGEDSPIYYAVCPVCGRFVKPDETSTIPEYLKNNATCAVHGRVAMPFCAWASELEDEA